MPTAAQHALKMELEAAIDQATNAVISGRTEVAAARQQLSGFVLACKALPAIPPIDGSKKFAGAAQIGKVLGCLWLFPSHYQLSFAFLFIV